MTLTLETPTIEQCYNWALFLDIDGTLVDIAPTPDSVTVLPTLPTLLNDLRQTLGGALALISGRSMIEIDYLFPGRLDAAGTHGVEWRHAGTMLPEDGNHHDAMSNLMPEIEDRVRKLPGLLIEKKSHSFALHYRQHPERESDAWSLAGSALQALGADFRLLFGKGVVEIVAANADKGMAIKRFMALPPYRGRIPVFVGDDVTDECGFQVVNQMGGVSIRVGDTSFSLARFKIGTPPELRAWLSAIAIHLETTRP